MGLPRVLLVRWGVSAAGGVFLLLTLSRVATGAQQAAGSPPATPSTTSLVYADFERMEDGRPVSTRGGLILMYSYEESHTHKPTFSSIEGSNPPAPEIVRIKKDDPNHAMKFDYALRAPNQWTGVTVEIHGLPQADGQFVPEDVSGFKTLSLQVYATGIEILRLETISGETGKDMTLTYPQKTFKVRPGFNTYKVPLSSFSQPEWVRDRRIDAKDILKKLTSINITAFCDQCVLNQQGTVVVDNIIFEK
jgi:hypothetical protein